MSTDSYRYLFAVSTAATLALLSIPALAQLPDFTGRPLVELVEALRNNGQRIAYSRDVLPARLRVEANPEAATAFDALRQILATHELVLEAGPNETWLIVARGSDDTATATRPHLPLQELPPPTLETVVVTASRYPIARERAAAATSFGRHTIETTPALGQDPLRITHRLPGVSSDQLTSRMHIRGGNLDEVLLRLDGIRLYSPYHLKDFQNVFSSINPDIIESMDVRTGGYEARFGDTMSGVIDMRSMRPTEFRHHEVSVSLLSTSALSRGLFHEGKGAWVTSIRRGNLDVLADVGDSDIGTPQYVDFFNRLDYAFSSRLELETGYLSLDDKIDLKDSDTASAAATYSDSYFWVNLHHQGRSGLVSDFRVSNTNLNRIRTGTIDDPDRLNGSLFETGKFDRTAISADWRYPLSDTVLLTWGAEYSGMDTRRRFQSERTGLQPILAPQLSQPGEPPTMADLGLKQSKRGVYVSMRYRPVARLVAEIGVRRDVQSLLDSTQTSPRLNLRLDLTHQTRLRAAWGKYAQSDTLAELALADGLTSLQPTETARHSVLGLEHEFGETGLLRIEAYHKRADRKAARFENIFERISLLPELLPDRFLIAPVSSSARGIEISIEGRTAAFGWWANMSAARATEELASGMFRLGWDERRSIKAGGEWTGSRWTVTATLGYRRGWPVSSISQTGNTIIAERFNASALPDFSSVDVRASRTLQTARGSIDWYMEISNLADHPNYCCIDYTLAPSANPSDDPVLATKYGKLFGIVPNFGIRWKF